MDKSRQQEAGEAGGYVTSQKKRLDRIEERLEKLERYALFVKRQTREDAELAAQEEQPPAPPIVKELVAALRLAEELIFKGSMQQIDTAREQWHELISRAESLLAAEVAFPPDPGVRTPEIVESDRLLVYPGARALEAFRIQEEYNLMVWDKDNPDAPNRWRVSGPYRATDRGAYTVSGPTPIDAILTWEAKRKEREG